MDTEVRLQQTTVSDERYTNVWNPMTEHQLSQMDHLTRWKLSFRQFKSLLFWVSRFGIAYFLFSTFLPIQLTLLGKTTDATNNDGANAELSVYEVLTPTLNIWLQILTKLSSQMKQNVELVEEWNDLVFLKLLTDSLDWGDDQVCILFFLLICRSNLASSRENTQKSTDARKKIPFLSVLQANSVSYALRF